MMGIYKMKQAIKNLYNLRDDEFYSFLASNPDYYVVICVAYLKKFIIEKLLGGDE